MTRGHRTALAASALTIGAALIHRALRAGRSIDFNGKAVLITGGRGLAFQMARQFAAEGARVMLVARDRGELDRARDALRAHGAEVSTFCADVMHRDQAIAAVHQIVERYGSIDVLINNAGIIQVGPLDHMTEGDFEEAMAVHFWGPLHMTLAAIPHMRQRGGGRVVNISSIGGKIGVPHLAPYCASKFALAGFSQAIHAELTRDDIYVTTVCPGMMRTGSPFNAWFKGRHRDEFTWFAVSDSMPVMSIDAARAAAQVIEACRHGDPELVITWPAKLAVMANGVMPEAVSTAMCIANRLLPAPTDDRSGDERHSGWQSLSDWAPSTLTTLTERAAVENNELPH